MMCMREYRVAMAKIETSKIGVIGAVEGEINLGVLVRVAKYLNEFDEFCQAKRDMDDYAVGDAALLVRLVSGRPLTTWDVSPYHPEDFPETPENVRAVVACAQVMLRSVMSEADIRDFVQNNTEFTAEEQEEVHVFETYTNSFCLYCRGDEYRGYNYDSEGLSTVLSKGLAEAGIYTDDLLKQAKEDHEFWRQVADKIRASGFENADDMDDMNWRGFLDYVREEM